MRILICTPHFPHCPEVLRTHLPHDDVHSCATDQIALAATEADVLIPAMYRIDAAIIARTSARLIHQFGVGLEGVDIPAATRRGIYVANVPGGESAGNPESVAEHAILLMLTLGRKYAKAADNVRHRVFGAPVGVALAGKTVAIIGVGSIGVALAQRLRGFQARIIGIKQQPDETIRQKLGLDFLGGPQDLRRVLAEADFVVLALPVTPTTRGLIDATALAQVKKSAFVVNVGRGPVIDHDALVEALAQEKIAGAGLDVFWDEPTDPADPLFRHNVIATPHIAGVTDLSYNDIARGLAANVERLRAGLSPVNCVNVAEVEARRSV